MRSVYSGLLLCFFVLFGGPAAAQASDASEARTALEELLANYAAGETTRAEAAIDPAMPNYQATIDHIRNAATRQKQIRMVLSDVQTATAGRVVFIQASWEKRFLLPPSLTPVLRVRKSTWTWHKTENGWSLIGSSGDDLFGP